MSSIGATRGLGETYTRYSGVDDEEQKKSKAILMVVLKLMLDII